MPDLISGITGSIDLGGGGGGMNQFDPLRFVTTLSQLKTQQQQTAAQQLQTAMEMVKQGVNVDPRELEKLAKQAGINPATGMPEKQTMEQRVGDVNHGETLPMPHGQQPQGQPLNTSSQTLSELGKTMAGPVGGYQAANQPSDNAASKAPAGGKSPNVVNQGNGMFDQFVSQARQQAMMSAQTQQQQQMVDQTIAGLYQRALTGDAEATGNLMRVGKVPFSSEMLNYLDPKIGPAQRERDWMVAKGMETPELKRQREERWAEAMFTKGSFNSPMDAMMYVRGEAGAPQPKVDLTRVIDEVKLANELVNAGVPPSQVRKIAADITAGASLSDVLPTDLKPVVMQQLEAQRAGLDEQKRHNQTSEGLQRRQLEMEEQETVKKYKAMAEKLETELAKAENAELKNNLDFLVNAERAGMDVPEGLMETTVSKIAERMGARLEEKPHAWYEFFDNIFGTGKEYQIVPQAGDVSAFTGTQQGSVPNAGGTEEGALSALSKFTTGPYGTGIAGSIVVPVIEKITGAVKEGVKKLAPGYSVTDIYGKRHDFPNKAEADKFKAEQDKEYARAKKRR